MGELSAYRKEIKYVIPLAKIPAVKRCMDHLMARDDYCTEDAYKIRSVYFESINNIDFAQKLAGIDVRKKVRLRTYNGADSLCKLELKQKKRDWNSGCMWILPFQVCSAAMRCALCRF